MTRQVLISGWMVCSLFVVMTNVATADVPATESSIDNRLKIQQVMEQANAFMHEDPGKAVQILEENLFRIDGNSKYLNLLRRAYSKHIPNLYINQQPELAQKYLKRLRILDPRLAKALLDNPRADLTTANSLTETNKEKSDPKQLQWPNKKGNAHPLPVVRLPESANVPVVQPVINTSGPPKVQPAAIIPEEVIARGNDRAGKGPSAEQLKRHRATKLLDYAELQFRKGQYCEAFSYYEKASEADSTVMENCRDRWAYCKLSHVMARLQEGTDSQSWTSLHEHVESAIRMEPKLAGIGNKMLQKIAQAKTAGSKSEVHHHANPTDNWRVAETAHFRIFHNQNRQFVDSIAQIAEKTRKNMSAKWFGSKVRSWKSKCDIYLHADADDYSKATKVHKQSPGHSRIESKEGEIVGRTVHLHCDTYDLLTAILPHEVTHVVLAGQFGVRDVPRWVDEGIAVLSEPEEKIQIHQQNARNYFQSGQLFGMQELMEQADYPNAERIRTFYAQSVSLVEFLTEQQEPQVFINFVRDGLQNGGYQKALQRHYGYQSFNQLQLHWAQHVQGQNGAMVQK